MQLVTLKNVDLEISHQNSFATQQMSRFIEKGIFFDDTDYFSLIIAFCEKRKIGAARTLCDYLPRRTGYFQVRVYKPKFL